MLRNLGSSRAFLEIPDLTQKRLHSSQSQQCLATGSWGAFLWEQGLFEIFWCANYKGNTKKYVKLCILSIVIVRSINSGAAMFKQHQAFVSTWQACGMLLNWGVKWAVSSGQTFVFSLIWIICVIDKLYIRILVLVLVLVLGILWNLSNLILYKGVNIERRKEKTFQYGAQQQKVEDPPMPMIHRHWPWRFH